MKKLTFILIILYSLKSYSQPNCPLEFRYDHFFSESAKIYQSDNVMSFTLKGEFQKAFDLAKVGIQDKNIDSNDPRIFEKFSGVMEYSDNRKNKILDIDFEVRGETSPKWAQFPKLHLIISNDEQRRESLFRGGKRIKLGTHMRHDFKNEKLNKSKNSYARLLNEKATHRESFVYKMMNILKLPSQLSRPVKMNYIGPKVQLEKNAFFFEHKRQLAKRYEMEVVSLGEKVLHGYTPIEIDFYEKIDRSTAIKVNLMQILAGQWDFNLPLKFQEGFQKTQIKNVFFLKDDCEKIYPIAEDFDLASIVTGKNQYIKNSSAPKRSSSLYKTMHANLIKIRLNISKKEYQTNKEFFLKNLYKLKNALKTYPMDEVGRKNVSYHLTTFEKVLRAN